MLGLGESPGELRQVFGDLVEAGCRILTLGQYLQPSVDHLPVVRYLAPEEFERWREVALKMGFHQVTSGPFVRSSFGAGELYEACERNRELDRVGLGEGIHQREGAPTR
jgi:lipoic acid synthetase